MKRSACSRSSFGVLWPSATTRRRPQGQPTILQQQRAALIEKITVVGRAVDVLQRTLKTRQVLAADSPNELYQLLDEAAKYMNDPPPHDDIVIEEYVPGSLPT